jgi:probable rRNA maturation factor
MRHLKVKIVNNSKERRPTEKWLQKVVLRTTRGLSKSKIPLKKKRQLLSAQSITLAFVSTMSIQKLNRFYRKINKPTDILSFSSLEAASLGELALCLPVIRRSARVHKVTFHEELAYILIHGILHLLDYDHEVDDKGAREMYALQDSIFEEMRVKWL